ncbi:chloride channel protein [Variovorax guangxiensis]|uniref:Chloride channel protein n=1 Tax=Variovorax guangxiensis TaxID=1775474 RepID=A0A502DHE9_9BURK|nr:chloride channel protein [Variovorax guangxiensis]TPG20240.1 chloride channel protein [Variovorax ginsengisoli]TPG23899.1 chloride channel protein [Variovorax guangxiensis]
MNHEPDFFQNLRAELSSFRLWIDRGIVLGYAVAAGLFVVGFTMASEWAFSLFQSLYGRHPWAVLLWTPTLTAAIVWTTRRWFPGASGSGIPQIKAALDPELPPEKRGLFASLRLTIAKIGLGAAGFLAGLSIGREGPSVQVAAGVMQHAKRWLSPHSTIDTRSLLVAGGAAGIAAAFNAPLAGVVFAIEELSGRLEARASGVIITGIVLAGLVAVSVFGNQSYFGVIRVPPVGWNLLGPGLLVAFASGVAGGLFSRLMIASLTGAPQRLNRWRARYPVRFAAVGGLLIAVIGLVTGGVTFGAGSEAVKQMLAGHDELTPLYTLLKFIATWLTAWCGVPGGIFAPSLSIGAGIGDVIAQVAGADLGPALIAMGMAGFLAAVTQAPLTAFIIVMEMVDGHSMVLSLMACAMLASLVSRMISRPLYEALAEHLVGAATARAPEKPVPAEVHPPPTGP